jgi:ribose transport system ATP-binding protein
LLICHRIVVMNHGRTVEVIEHDQATKERIMTAAAITASNPLAANGAPA